MTDYSTKFWRVITYDYDGDYEGVSSNLPLESVLARLQGVSCYYTFIKHDKDVFEDGTEKKAHYHWIVEFKSKRKLSYVLELFGVNVAYPCSPDITLNYRYLLHLDNPEKWQYFLSEVQTCLLPDMLELRMTGAGIEDEQQKGLHVLAYAEMVARGDACYRDLYRAFPHMVHKAHVVSCLVSQVADDIKNEKERRFSDEG